MFRELLSRAGHATALGQRKDSPRHRIESGATGVATAKSPPKRATSHLVAGGQLGIPTLGHDAAKHKIEKVVHGSIGERDPVVHWHGPHLERVVLCRMELVLGAHQAPDPAEHDEIGRHQRKVVELVRGRETQPLPGLEGAQVLKVCGVREARSGAVQGGTVL